MQADPLARIADTHHPEFVGNNEHDRPAAGARIDAERTRASGYHQAQVTRIRGIGFDQGLDCRRYLLPSPGQHQPDSLGRLLQSLEVRLEHEGRAVIEAQTLEYAITVKQAMIENRDRGLVGGNNRILDPAECVTSHIFLGQYW